MKGKGQNVELGRLVKGKKSKKAKSGQELFEKYVTPYDAKKGWLVIKTAGRSTIMQTIAQFCGPEGASFKEPDLEQKVQFIKDMKDQYYKFSKGLYMRGKPKLATNVSLSVKTAINFGEELFGKEEFLFMMAIAKMNPKPDEKIKKIIQEGLTPREKDMAQIWQKLTVFKGKDWGNELSFAFVYGDNRCQFFARDLGSLPKLLTTLSDLEMVGIEGPDSEDIGKIQYEVLMEIKKDYISLTKKLMDEEKLSKAGGKENINTLNMQLASVKADMDLLRGEATNIYTNELTPLKNDEVIKTYLSLGKEYKTQLEIADKETSTREHERSGRSEASIKIEEINLKIQDLESGGTLGNNHKKIKNHEQMDSKYQDAKNELRTLQNDYQRLEATITHMGKKTSGKTHKSFQDDRKNISSEAYSYKPLVVDLKSLNKAVQTLAEKIKVDLSAKTLLTKGETGKHTGIVEGSIFQPEQPSDTQANSKAPDIKPDTHGKGFK